MQAAYDLERFEERRNREEEQQQLRVVRSERKAARARRMVKVRQGLAICMLILLLCGLLYSRATLAAVTADIQQVGNRLNAEKSQNDYLTGLLNDATNMKNVEEYAAGQLGLCKADKSQITYVNLQHDSAITRTESEIQRFLAHVQTVALSLWGELDP